jgi:hypothetical protein
LGAYICTISESDWDTARNKGVYGNRYYKEGTRKPLSDNLQLSVMRDLISVERGDTVFFHIRRRKTVHGPYTIRSEPFWDPTPVWQNPIEIFPYRFLFEPHENHKTICLYDTAISVSSLYELIDQGEIKSLVTLEFEQNIERRAVRRIFEEDARKITRLFYRDFNPSSQVSLNFNPYMASSLIPLKDKVFKVERIENAIKAVISYLLAHKDPGLTTKIGDILDFVNEFFVAPTTRKNIDILCKGEDLYMVIEVKRGVCDKSVLKQALYYADLLRQRPWFKERDGKCVVLVASNFEADTLQLTHRLNQLGNSKIILIKYKSINNGRWAQFV